MCKFHSFDKKENSCYHNQKMLALLTPNYLLIYVFIKIEN